MTVFWLGADGASTLNFQRVGLVSLSGVFRPPKIVPMANQPTSSGAWRMISALLKTGLVTAACTRSPPPTEPRTGPSFPATAASGSEERRGRPEAQPSPAKVVEPSPRELGTLTVPGFLPAPLFVPSNVEEVTSELRVFVLAHGAGGRGEHHCTFWEPQLPSDIVLICPQGSLLRRGEPEGGAYFPDHLALRKELLALIDATQQRFSDHIADSDWRFIGYSQGATMGALAIVGEISIFSDLVLIEGGGENWTLQRALDFKGNGGERVLLACGTNGCAKRAEKSVEALEQAGLWARHQHANGVGHTYGGGVGRAVLETMMTWERSP